ncbi:MAG: sensor histidine kinase [Ignavibacteriales bacterium]
MKMSGGPGTRNIKIILLIIAFIIASGTVYYTRMIVEKLQHKEKQIVELYAKSLEYLANTNDPSTNLTFIFENVIKPIDFPIILTDTADQVNLSNKSGYRNLQIDSTLSLAEQKKFLANQIKDMDAINPPIIISYSDSIVFGKIHYGDSQLIRQLRNYPYLQILFAAMFVLIAYISFSYIKKNEQSNIWVGMSKETAHQLGTPISSLMGWSEILKLSHNNPDKVLDISEEINNDLARLNKITQRFSKIGSQPELKDTNLYETVERTIKYFERRLPQIGKNVVLKLEGNEDVCAKLSPELFEWVLENLIKNALDAIESKRGSIAFSITETHKHAEIEVKDTGKGIDPKRKKDIFRPGYSTKRRGWGLGLSLSKRIVENYHNGKIFVKHTGPEGTTFKIILKKT